KYPRDRTQTFWKKQSIGRSLILTVGDRILDKPLTATESLIDPAEEARGSTPRSVSPAESRMGEVRGEINGCEGVDAPSMDSSPRSEGGKESATGAGEDRSVSGGGGSPDSVSPHGVYAPTNGLPGAMPRNFRLSIEGYDVLTDADGKYAAYSINVTAGLHQWRVLRRYRQFLSLHQVMSQHISPSRMPNLPGKRILGSSVEPSFAENRGLALQVYLGHLVGLAEAWQVPQMTGFLDERASMMGVQGQISQVLDHVDRLEGVCVDLQRQLNNSQLQVQGQNELVETLCRRIHQLEKEATQRSRTVSTPSAKSSSPLPPRPPFSPNPYPITHTGSRSLDNSLRGGLGAAAVRDGGGSSPLVGVADPMFGYGPGIIRRSSSLHNPSGSFPVNIDMSDLDNLVKRVESESRLAVPSDEEGEEVDTMLARQHEMMREGSTFSLDHLAASNPNSLSEGLMYMQRAESNDFYLGSIDTGAITQGIRGLLDGGEDEEDSGGILAESMAEG
ncbi:unnamed protein product, partial [Discosporangium mesarthrocarpum]